MKQPSCLETTPGGPRVVKKMLNFLANDATFGRSAQKEIAPMSGKMQYRAAENFSD
jgi:hypothetical protein